MTAKKLIGYSLIIFAITIVIYYFYPDQKLPANSQIDSIVIFKSKKELLAYSKGKLLKTYKISLGRNPDGNKQYEGDLKTPEGIYFINDKNPNSGYHKNLGISYPNMQDIVNAKKLGRPTGGDVKIHGLRNGLGAFGKFHRWFSTRGCIRVTDSEVDELYSAVAVGTPIEIKP